MYLSWNKKTITNFSDKNINSLYNEGYVFTRVGKGAMNQTRSVRINLDNFELTSENKRILRKTENLKLETFELPYSDYSWEIGKFGKDFYETKFGSGVFTANKIKENLTNKEKSNFNTLFTYKEGSTTGYTICYADKDILHYSYPFYDLSSPISNLGIGMMTKAIVWAKENNKKYIYLGSATGPKAKYKLQFKGLEWFDGENWREDLEELKNILK